MTKFINTVDRLKLLEESIDKVSHGTIAVKEIGICMVVKHYKIMISPFKHHINPIGKDIKLKELERIFLKDYRALIRNNLKVRR